MPLSLARRAKRDSITMSTTVTSTWVSPEETGALATTARGEEEDAEEEEVGEEDGTAAEEIEAEEETEAAESVSVEDD